jgi:prevent-host-death family protein
MKWSIAKARQRLSELIKSSQQAPQSIFKRGRLVAAVVDAQTFEEFKQWRKKQNRLGDAFRELRKIEEKEGYELIPPPRVDRENSFAGSLNGLSD